MDGAPVRLWLVDESDCKVQVLIEFSHN
jgi:hypothetical protein